ncbi:MAG: DUF333 domain-containing protein [Bacteroidota bacterium]
MRLVCFLPGLLTLIIPLFIKAQPDGLADPSAVYCNRMGYHFEIMRDPQGNETGRCLLPDGSAVSSWDFLRGKAGREFSWCVKNGYAMETEILDHGGYRTEKPLCVKYADGKAIAKYDMLVLMDQPPSREILTLSGLVTDSATGKGLPFAQISLQNSTTGTVTNEEGFFRINIPGLFSHDTLLVAYLGYTLKKLAIPGHSGSGIEIRMNPKIFELSEVEIVALSPEEVIRRVVAHIPANYGEEPLILTAFIRSRKFLGNKLAEFTEAIIEDMKTGYSLTGKKEEKERHRLSNTPLLLKGRVISDTSLVNAIGELGKSAGCLGCNFIHDFVEFYHQTVLDEELFRYYKFRMEELIRPEGGKIYHIWFDQKKGVKETLWRGELFINASDFALLKVTQKPSFEAFDQFEKQKYKRPYTINATQGWFQEMPLMDWTTTYSLRNGSYYLNTILVENWLTFTNPATRQKLKFSHKNEVVVTDATRDPEKLKNFRGDKSTGVNQRWDQIVGPQDDRFWATFNYLPLEKTLQETLRKMNAGMQE